MKIFYRFIVLLIISMGALKSFALEINTSPYLSSITGFKFNTLNVLMDKEASNIKWGPTVGLGKASEVTLVFIGARVEYNSIKVLYAATGISGGFLKKDDEPTVTFIPLVYAMGGAKFQYSNYIFKAGVGLTTPNLFNINDGTSMLDDQEKSNIGPAFEFKVGYRF